MVGNGNNNRSALVCEYIRCIFHDCKSEAGGGLFIWGNGRDVLPFVNDCIFYKNEGGLKKASEGDEGSVSSGGGGLLIQGHHSIVQNSKFYENKGIGCNILIYGDTGGSIDQIKPHQIINCTLTILTDEYTSSSLFYAGSKKSTLPLEIISCIFDGTITDTADLKKYQINTNKTASRIVKITFENTFICTGRDSAVEEGFDEKDIIESGLIFECSNSTDPTEPIQPTEKPTENPPKPGDLTPLECGKAVRKEDGQSTYSFYIDDCEFSGFSSSGSSNGGAICLKNYGLRCLNSRFSSCESKEGKGGAIFHQIGAVSSQNTTEYVMEYYNCNFTSCTAVAGGGLYLYNTKSTNYIYVTKCTFNNNRATKTDSSGDDEANANVGGGGLHFQGFHATISNCIFSDNFGIGSNILISMNDKGQIQDTKLINCNLTLKGSNDAKSSLYYSAGKNANKGLFIKSCIFDGSVNEESYQINTNSEKDNNPMIRFEGTYICTGEYRVIEGGFTTNIPKDGLIFECSNSTDPTEPIQPTEKPTENPPKPGDLTPLECGKAVRKEDGQSTYSFYIDDCEFSGFSSSGSSNGGAICLKNYGLRCLNSRFSSCESKEGKGGAIFHQIGAVSSQNTTEYVMEYYNCNFTSCTAVAGGGLYLYNTKSTNYIYVTKCTFNNNRATKTDSSGDDEANANVGGGGLHFQGFHATISNCIFSDNFGIGSNILISMNDKGQIQDTKLINCNLTLKGSNDAKSSLYYSAGKNANKGLFIKSCIFDGSVNEESYQINTNSEKDNNPMIRFEGTYICTGEYRVIEGGFTTNIPKDGLIFECSNSTDPTEPIQPTEKPTENPPKPGDLTPLECGKAVRKEDGQSTYSFYIDDCEFSGFSSSGSSNGGAICLKNYGLRCLNSRFSSCESKEGKGGAIFHQIGAVSSQNTTEYVMEYYNCNFTSCTAVAGGGLYLYNTKSTNYIYVTKCTFNNNRATKTDSSGDDEANANVGGGGLHFQGFHATISNCIFSDNFGIGSNILISMNDKGQIQDTKLINCNLTLKGSSDAKSSLYYSAGKNANKGLFIKSCIFDGSVNEESYQINTNSEKDNNPMIRFEGTYICTGEYRVIEGGFTTNIPKDGLIFECSNSTDPTEPVQPSENPTEPIQPTEKPTENPPKPGDLTPLECGKAVRKEDGQSTYSFYIDDCEFSGFSSSGSSNGGAICLKNYGLRCLNSRFSSCESKEGKGGAIFHQIGAVSSQNTTEYVMEYYNCNFTSCTAVAGGGLYLYNTKSTNYIYVTKCTFNNNRATKTDSSGDDEANANVGGGGLHFQGFHATISNCIFSDNFGIGSNILISMNDKGQIQDTKLINCNLTLKGSNDAKSSLYYSAGKNANKGLFIKSCIFDGSVNEESYQINTNSEKDNNPMIRFEGTYICTGEYRVIEGGFTTNIPKDGLIFECSNSTDPTEKPTKPIDPSQTANPSNVPPELTCHDNERCDFGEGTVENTTKVIIEKSKFSKIHGDSDGGAVFISGYSFSCTKSKFEDCSSKNQGGAIYLKLGLRKYEKDLHAEIADSIFKDCKAKGGAGIFAHSTVAGRLIYINKCEFENNEAVNMSKSDDASILTSESSDINIGGGGIFFVTNGGFVENCVFKDNKGIGADMIIYVSNDIDSSLRQQTIIRKCNFYFEGDDESPSSIYLIRNTKNAINVTLQDCVFKGEISIKHGIVPHFIDADELKSRSGLLVLKDVYFCGFDEEQAFQGNVSNYINVSESSYFFDCTNLPNDKESETGLSKGGKVAIAIVIPLVVIAVIIVVVIFLVFKKKNTKMTQEEPTNELSETFQSSTDFYASQGSENNPIGFTSNMEEQDPFMREFEEASNVSPV